MFHSVIRIVFFKVNLKIYSKFLNWKDVLMLPWNWNRSIKRTYEFLNFSRIAFFKTPVTGYFYTEKVTSSF